MKQSLGTLKVIELFGWILALLITFFCFGTFFIFIGVVVGIRHFYLKWKKESLGRLSSDGKSVVVTGCDSGFGLALAKRLHENGLKVFAMCLSLSSDGAKSLQSLKSEKMKVVTFDVRSDELVAKCLEVVKTECDQTGLWGLVNNSGVNYLGDAEMTTMEMYTKTCDVNLFGVIRMCKAFLPLIRQAKGRIVNVTSSKGRCAVHGADAYTVSKFGAQAFAEVLRQEMRHFGVKVITIEPGKFGGATGQLKGDAMTALSAQLDDMWDQASPDVQQAYGKTHFQSMLDSAKNSIATTYPTMDPVIDAEVDALMSVCPQPRYLVDGSNYYFDRIPNVIRFGPFLPETLYDIVCGWVFPYVVHK